MKVAIVGYGRMGKEIEKILLERGHQVVSKFSSNRPLTAKAIQEVEVAIEFSNPHVVLENIRFLIGNNIPIVVGTTGWNSYLEEVTRQIEISNGAMVYASNFSIGVNLFFQLNEKLAQLMDSYLEYSPKITEIHHTEKLDSPSGTAITLAEGIIENTSRFSDWYCLQSNKNNKQKASLEIEALREAGVKGTHQISYTSTIDEISIQHKAFSRQGFALGAVIAAEWLINKKGIFTLKDVLQLS